MTAW